MTERNWAGNLTYGAERVRRPASIEELQELLARADRVKILGARHAFNGAADAPELVALDALDADVRVDPAAGHVSVPAAMRYGRLAAALAQEGLALHNLASLPHVTVAGGVATGTHGSGDANGNLATAVAGLELVTSSGELVTAARGDAAFDGMVVGLGALGAVTRLTLDVEPAYAVRQRVYEHLAWDALFADFDAIFAAGYSVSVFTLWGEDCDTLWVKSRVDAGSEDQRDELFGATAATVDHHPIPGMDPVNCSAQLGVPGPWWDRLPHFRMAFTPSHGDELQSEYLVPRRHAVAAIEAVRGLAGVVRPLLLVSELRTMAADAGWMSPQHGTDTVGLHFTWRREPEDVGRALVALEDALAPFAARPHWGKVFVADAASIAPRYERHPDFVALAERLDPRGAFVNPWLRRHVLGPE
jgi:alditol oxidase